VTKIQFEGIFVKVKTCAEFGFGPKLLDYQFLDLMDLTWITLAKSASYLVLIISVFLSFWRAPL